MPSDFVPSQPEKEQIALVFTESGREIKDFTAYSFNSNFLTPTDGFTFTIGEERLSAETKNELKPGASVHLSVDGLVQATGFIDSLDISGSRGNGSVWHVGGRDRLAQAVDACADPTKSFKEGQTLEACLVELFTPFGWKAPDNFAISGQADRDVKTKKFRAKTQRSDAKGFGRKALAEYKLHQNKPYPREGVFEFASRITQRFGLWLWSSADGKTLIVAEPDFSQDPSYSILRNQTGTTNVIDGSVKFDMSEQPTHIIADSYSQGGEFGRGVCKAVYANTVMLAPEALDVTKYVNAGAKVLGGHTFPASSSMASPRTRVLYLHDDESQNQEQLEAFVRREMALLQRKSLTANYVVEGHGQIVDGSFTPWAVDTTVHVVDELAGLEETLYVLGVTYNKSRGSGTTTHLELIRLNTLVFSDPSKTKHG